MDNPKPTSPPPSGNITQTRALVGMTIAMLSLSIIFVTLRFITRVFVVRRVGWDDWTILFALLGTCIGAGLDFVEFAHGYGVHRYYVNDSDYATVMMYAYGEWIQTFATLMWTKISICLFLLRIPVKKILIWPLKIAIVILVVSNIILTVLWIVQCRPIGAVWNTELQANAQCWTKLQKQHIILWQAVISCVSDFALAFFPILLLKGVRISRQKKAALCLLMGLGVITGACCIVRTIRQWWDNETQDNTWDNIDNWMWRCLEVNFGMAAACLPTLYPGYKYIKVKYRAWLSARRGSLPDSEKALAKPPRDITKETDVSVVSNEKSGVGSLISAPQVVHLNTRLETSPSATGTGNATYITSNGAIADPGASASSSSAAARLGLGTRSDTTESQLEERMVDDRQVRDGVFLGVVESTAPRNRSIEGRQTGYASHDEAKGPPPPRPERSSRSWNQAGGEDDEEQQERRLEREEHERGRLAGDTDMGRSRVRDEAGLAYGDDYF